MGRIFIRKRMHCERASEECGAWMSKNSEYIAKNTHTASARVARAEREPREPDATRETVSCLYALPSVEYFPGLSRDFDCFDFFLEWDGIVG
jgi:hypothetical protein